MISAALTALALTSIQPASVYAGPAFYVSTSGSDYADGSVNHPWLTAHHARDRNRHLLPAQAADLINTLTGAIAPTSTLKLVAADSGQNGNRVIWTSPSGSLEGGVSVTGWSVFSGAIYRAPYSGVNPRAAWTDGVRDGRSKRGSGLVSATLTGTGYTTTDLASAINPANIELVYNNYAWTESRNVITAIGGGAITMRSPAHAYLTGASGLYLTTPTVPADVINNWTDFQSNATQGTFYYDEAAGYLYYVPRTGENMASVSFKVPILETVILAQGASAITFSNLNVYYSNWDMRPSGLASFGNNTYFDASHTWDGNFSDPNVPALPPAMVTLENCNDVQISTGSFSRTSATALTIRGSSVNSSVIGLRVEDAGGNGVHLSEYTAALDSTVPSGCDFTQSRILNVGQDFLGSVSFYGPFFNDSHIENNLVQGSPYLGIAVGAGLSYQPGWQVNKVGNNYIRYNEVAYTHLMKLDGGAIYSMSNQAAISGGTGLIITDNFVHDVGQGYTSLTSPKAAYYIDQGGVGITESNNVMVRVGTAMFFNGVNEDTTGGSNTVGTNYSDTSNSGNNNSPMYTAVTVSANPSTSGPGAAIAAAAGPQPPY